MPGTVLSNRKSGEDGCAWSPLIEFPTLLLALWGDRKRSRNVLCSQDSKAVQAGLQWPVCVAWMHVNLFGDHCMLYFVSGPVKYLKMASDSLRDVFHFVSFTKDSCQRYLNMFKSLLNSASFNKEKVKQSTYSALPYLGGSRAEATSSVFLSPLEAKLVKKYIFLSSYLLFLTQSTVIPLWPQSWWTHALLLR